VRSSSNGGWGRIVPWSFGAAGAGFAAYLFLIPYADLRDELSRRTEEASAARSAADEVVKDRDRLKAEAAKGGDVDAARLARTAIFRQKSDAFAMQLKRELGPLGADVVLGPDRVVVRIPESSVFEGQGADISETGERTLRLLGDALKAQTAVRAIVAAHLDETPVPANLRDLFPTTWELSAARATLAVRFLHEEGGVPWRLLLAAAGAEFHPPPRGGRAIGARRLEVEIEPE